MPSTAAGLLCGRRRCADDDRSMAGNIAAVPHPKFVLGTKAAKCGKLCSRCRAAEDTTAQHRGWRDDWRGLSHDELARFDVQYVL